MKTEHTANIILALVLLTALGGIYYMYTGPGQAIALPSSIDTLGSCCCQDPDTIVKIPATVLSSDKDLESDCETQCRARGTTSRPVLPLGAC